MDKPVKDMAFLLKKYGAKVGATDDFQADVLEVFETLKRKKPEIMSDKQQGTLPWFFEMLQSGAVTNLLLDNEDGANMIAYMKNRDALSNYRATINYKPGQTLFEKLKP